ncbi:MAG: hypothetical protein H8E42_08405 [Nitrospinae bacterium]|nr:hypothetical protein [Nitrospinota bacterium]MBL7020340.1 hypothetical protein [Nitrospinaceae bacterium]
MTKHRPIFLFLFVYFVLLSGMVQAKTDDGGNSQKQAEIEGFRSAQFGMNERDVMKAIFKDFKTKRRQVSRFEHPTEKTVSLGIDVDKLLPNSGPAKVFYILGHKSKRLIHVNIIWGKPATAKPDAENVVATANQLRNHLAQKSYQKEGLALNAQLSEDIILVFQGLDKKGRAVKLVLVNPKADPKKVGENISLTLSYIEEPGKPDVFRIKDGDF